MKRTAHGRDDKRNPKDLGWKQISVNGIFQFWGKIGRASRNNSSGDKYVEVSSGHKPGQKEPEKQLV